MTSSHNQPDQPPMASLIDLDEYVMPDIQHSDESDGTYSITMTPVSGSEYGGDDEKEPLMPEESLPTTTAKEPLMPTKSLPTTAKESLPTTTAKESLPTTTTSVSEAHAGTQNNLAPPIKVVWAKHARQARNSLELSFKYGETLHVIGREGDHWYKAFKPAQPDNRGLVPVDWVADFTFWDTTLGCILQVIFILSASAFICFGLPSILYYGFAYGIPSFLDWLSFVKPTTPCTLSSSCGNQVQVPLCGPTKPYEPYHLLPAYNTTAYGILDCNHNATHAELLQSFFDKSTVATLAHFYNRGQTPNEIDCQPWKRPMLRDAEESLRSGLDRFTPEEWAIQWFFLKGDRPVADAEILPSLGIDTPGPISCHNDETSLRRRSYQYIAQMEVVRQEIARKRQLEINKELEDKTKKSGEKIPYTRGCDVVSLGKLHPLICREWAT